MMWTRAKIRVVTAAQRGQIVQRILVDGWSAAEAAARFGVGERQIARWVRAYRRRGMASLRAAAVSDRAYRRWLWQLRATLAQLRPRLRIAPDAEPARCIALRRHRDERHSSGRRR